MNRSAPDEGDDQRLLAHIEQEFGTRGIRAVEFLTTAKVLLSSTTPAPRAAETVCYCVREALKEILQAAETVPLEPWSVLSRRVVDALKRYEETARLPGSDKGTGLDELLWAIGQLETFHTQERIHLRRLVAVMAARTGTSPIPAGPVKAYVELLDRLDTSLHSSANLADMKGMLDQALSLLRQLFMPPEIRLERLLELAKVASPNAQDAERVIALIATGQHLSYFFERVISEDWLRLLDTSDFLAPPNGEGDWPVIRYVERFKDSAGQPFGEWLIEALERWGGRTVIQEWFIARAAVPLGVFGAPVIIEFVKRQTGSPSVAALAANYVRTVAPQEEVVLTIADLLLNLDPRTSRSFGWAPITKALIQGVTAENWQERLQLVVYKLRSAAREDSFLFQLAHDQRGSLVDQLDPHDDRQSAVLLNTLVNILRAAKTTGVPGTELVASVHDLRPELRPRVVAWLLAQTHDVTVETIRCELLKAITTRMPCGDDIPLVDRAVGADSPSFIDAVKTALGQPPSVEELGTALADGSLQEAWTRARNWISILPDSAGMDWSGVNAALEGVLGPTNREMLAKKTPLGRFAVGRSPLTEAQLAEMPVEDAARRVAAWRRDPNEWLVGNLELARTLEAVVKVAPHLWAKSPMKIVSLLREPIYISHYFRGLAAAQGIDSRQSGDLVQAVSFVRTHPWTATDLGREGWDFDSTWAQADDAAVSLLRKLADEDIGFAERSEVAWRIVLESTKHDDEPAQFDEPLMASMNRPRTKAVAALLDLMSWEYRQTQTVRSEALNLLDQALHIPGRDGEQHRAVIVPNLPFLHDIAPDWTTKRTGLFLGDDAPEGLAEKSIDLYVQWGSPNKWVYEHSRQALADAVRRGAENALRFWIIAMLRNEDKYGVDDTVHLLSKEDKYLSQAGEELGRLLRRSEADESQLQTAAQFFEAVIALGRPESIFGFGWFADISSLDNDTWLRLTAEAARLSGGRLDWSHQVAERAAASHSVKGLQILNDLIKGATNDWDRTDVMEKSLGALTQNPHLQDTDAFLRLKRALLERGVFRAQDL